MPCSYGSIAEYSAPIGGKLIDQVLDQELHDPAVRLHLVRDLRDPMTLVVEDHDLRTGGRIGDLLTLLERYARVVASVDDQQRRPDLRGAVEWADLAQELGLRAIR